MATADTPSAESAWLRTARQFVRFALIGGSGVIVNMAVSVILNLLNGGAHYSDRILFPLAFGFNFRYSSLVWWVAFVVANLYNYQLNRVWTFRGTRRGWWQGFGQFMATGALAALVGWLLKAMMLNPTSVLYLRGVWFDGWQGRPAAGVWEKIVISVHSREYLAQLIAILVTLPINFVVNKLWTFRHHPSGGTPVSASETVLTSAGAGSGC
jgi:putative flippase GtrA